MSYSRVRTRMRRLDLLGLKILKRTTSRQCVVVLAEEIKGRRIFFNACRHKMRLISKNLGLTQWSRTSQRKKFKLFDLGLHSESEQFYFAKPQFSYFEAKDHILVVWGRVEERQYLLMKLELQYITSLKNFSQILKLNSFEI